MCSSDIFFTRFAKSYSQYVTERQAYLSAIDNFIQTETIATKTMVDVGSGDGKRGKLISKLLNVEDLVFIDNSEGMIDLARNIAGATVIKTDISNREFKSEKKYGVVLCLWNVLGHIATDKRKTALKNIASLAEKNGIIFLDVNNRYNIVSYGIKSVFKNIFKDIFIPKKSNGDFSLKVNAEGAQINTIVHIFNPFEVEYLLKSAGLSILKREIINYKTGEIKNNFWQGQLVYKLAKI